MDVTKKALIEKLLKEGKISKDDAHVLGREPVQEIMPQQKPYNAFPYEIQPVIRPNPYNGGRGLMDQWIQTEMDRRANHAERCACNPANGGSGICGCVLAGPVITC